MAKKKSWAKRVFTILGLWALLFLLGEAVWVFFISPWASNFGATRAEREMPLPGDQFVPNAFDQSTFAVTITAPAEEVWRWLIQIGQDRGGFYSLTFLENLVGGDIHNRIEIRPEWQKRKVGDLVRLAPPSERDPAGRLALPVLAVEPPHFLYLKGWGAFVLMPAAGGGNTRFFIRGRNDMGMGARIAIKLFLEPIHFIMQRRMMLGIKEVAEAGPEKPVIPSTGDYVWFLSLVAAGLLILIQTISGFTMKKLPAFSGAAVLVVLGLFRLTPSPAFGVMVLLLVVIVFIARMAGQPR